MKVSTLLFYLVIACVLVMDCHLGPFSCKKRKGKFEKIKERTFLLTFSLGLVFPQKSSCKKTQDLAGILLLY